MGEIPTEDEDLTPTMENFIVLTWLRLIDHQLPALVKQKYGPELRSKTLASLKPEISLALDSLLDEIATSNDAKILRSSFRQSRKDYKSKSSSRRKIECPLCKQASRKDYNHYLSTCQFLPDQDRQFMTKVRQTYADNDSENDSDFEQTPIAPEKVSFAALRVGTKQSPTLKMFYNQFPVCITLDTGAETSMVKESFVKYINAPVTKSSQHATQADGVTPLNIIGETHITLTRGKFQFKLDALVVGDLDVDVLGGVTFMAANDISTRPAKQQIVIHDREIAHYGNQSHEDSSHRVRRTQVSFVLRAPSSSQFTWPGSYVELNTPSEVDPDGSFAVEPKSPHHWWFSPQIVDAVSGKIRIVNCSDEPVITRKDEHVCDARHTGDIYRNILPTPTMTLPKNDKKKSSSENFADTVLLDPDQTLSVGQREAFRSVLQKYDNVFSPKISGYNGAVGSIKAVVNMGPTLPPQRKGRVPQYSRDKLSELQDKFDELEEQGVFSRPEDVDVNIEYINSSFLVKKSQGGYRLVTAFADVGRYSKPQPSLMPDVESVLRSIGQWKYLIKSDLKSAFYQIPLSKDSYKYCGVATPYKGVRVYTRCAMGMPGSETALEELMCRILGDLLQEGIVCKLADDLYCGGNTPTELAANWECVLSALDKCNIKLSPTKTVVCPRSTNVLGWVWNEGQLSASPHRISTLVSCQPPDSVYGLRSFIGAYKVLGKVLPQCSSYLAPLDDLTAGRQSHDKLQWDARNLTFFENAKRALNDHKSIVIPQTNDQLWIVTDGSVKKHGIGATLYVSRNDKLMLAGFFSAKLRKHQVTWLPCEIEALSIGAAIKHFSPYIVQSSKTTYVLTDSQPCVQSVQKLYRGEFSSSPRVTSFLSNVSRYQVTVKHLAGSANVPSDFASRNAPACVETRCQICSFIQTMEDSVVRSLQIDDILNDTLRLPFTTRSAWRNIQAECPDLRRVHSHLKQGTRPSKKLKKLRDVKRYLNVAVIAKDNILVVKRSEPFSREKEQIIVPRTVLDGLLTAIHVKLDHPTKHQLDLVIRRNFFALDMTRALDRITEGCHVCASIKKFPKTLIEQSSESPPDSIGTTFAADVMKRSRQNVLVLRETVTSYTKTKFIENEQKGTLRDALVCLVNDLHPLHGPQAIVRVDPAPAFIGLRDDKFLKDSNIVLDIGRIKNVNKNPVAEKAIAELEDELLRIQPGGEPLTEVQLSVATNRLNCRLRRNGISSRELWTQRDQFTHDQIPLSDTDIIISQHSARYKNHKYSEKSKFPNSGICENINVGDIVYLISDKSKHVSRKRYIVTSIDGEWCYIKKFVGSQLRSTSYKVKRSECFKVPSDLCDIHVQHYEKDSDSSDPGSDCELNTTEKEIPIPNTLTNPHEEEVSRPPPDIMIMEQDHTSHDTCNVIGADSNPGFQNLDSTGLENIVTRPKRSRNHPKYLDDYVLT